MHRGAHRQAVHRAEPDLGWRVQLRGVGAERGSTSKQRLSCVTNRPHMNRKPVPIPLLGSGLSVYCDPVQWLKQDSCLHLWINVIMSRRTACWLHPEDPPPLHPHPTSWFLNCLQHHQCHALVRQTSKKKMPLAVGEERADVGGKTNQDRETWDISDTLVATGKINELSFLTFAVVCYFLSLLSVLILGKNIVRKLLYWLLSTFKCKNEWQTWSCCLSIK